MQDLFGNEVIRSLGLHQPYASLMWTHNKIETRWVKKGKKPPFPLGTYMIYATQKIYKLDEVENISGHFLPKEMWVNDMRYAIIGQPLVICHLESVYDYVNPGKVASDTFVLYKVSDTHRLVCLKFSLVQRIKYNGIFKGKQGVGILTPEQKSLIEFI